MTLSRLSQWGVRIVAVMLSGILFELSCAGLGEVAVRNVNPCGTVFNCSPVEYDLLTTDYPDWNVDPTCTIPGQCSENGTWPLLGNPFGTDVNAGPPA
ncbi:MAG: hypothetical protein HY718_08755 [Planctomycetes bacterium]|nr:hypothetical protein [Planctomycetota bacterium]